MLFANRCMFGIIALILGLASQLSLAGGEEHYLARYKPVLHYTLDQAVDDTEKLAALNAKVNDFFKDGPPTRISGARPFTGNAWDFTDTRACLEVFPGEKGYVLGDTKASKGISISYWQKGLFKGAYINCSPFWYHWTRVAIGNGRGKGDIRGDIGNEYRAYMNVQSGETLFDGKWHHVVFTVDFTKTKENIAIYLDGKRITLASGDAITSFNTTNLRTPFNIGARNARSYEFTGALDDLAMFDYALSPDQVAAIYTGPGFPGIDQEIYFPNDAQLQGLATEGQAVFWKKISGPGEVHFAKPTQAKTLASFSKPGEYVLQFKVAGRKASRLTVKVNPTAPPRVDACDPIKLQPGQHQQILAGQINQPGNPTLNGVTYQWKQISGPGKVRFASPQTPETAATFPEPGLYRLELKACQGELSATGQTSVLLAPPMASEHYAQALNPVYILPMDQPANRQPAGTIEMMDNTAAQMHKYEATLPLQSPGARAFTGMSWDFAPSPGAIMVHNSTRLFHLGNPEKTNGLAVSFWVRMNNYRHSHARIGDVNAVREISPYPNGRDKARLQFMFGEKFYQTSKERNFADGQWRHVVIWADFRAKSEQLRVYIDGTLDTRLPLGHIPDVSSIRTAHSHYWGCRSNGNNPFFGQLDDIAVFDRPISEAEISYLYKGPEAHMPLTTKMIPAIKMGPDQILELPARATMLHAEPGNKSHTAQTTYQWRLVDGPGKVSFSTPNKLTTEVTFAPLGPGVHNPDYRQYSFELTANNALAPFELFDKQRMTVIVYKPVAPKTRRLSATPPVGIHPRVLFAPEDLPGMRERAKADPVAQAAIKAMKERYARTLFNPREKNGFAYAKLLAGETDFNLKNAVLEGINDVYGYTQGRGDFYGRMCGAGFLAMLEEDDAKARELATVLSRAAELHLTFYRPKYRPRLPHDANAGLGLAYDFLYNHLTEAQRKPIRKLLSLMTRHRFAFAVGTPPEMGSTNWATFHDHIILASLAIEGEEGYDPIVYRSNINKLRNFLTEYGIFRSGCGHEGWGYVNFGLVSGSLSALATARRNENLYETTNLYNSLIAQYYSMPPGMNYIFAHGDSGDGRLKMPGNQVMVGRFLWPDDPAVQFLGSRLCQNLIEYHDKRLRGMMAVMFATGAPKPRQTPRQIAKTLSLPLTLFCKDKGYFTSRSSWEPDALMLTFRCRMDKYHLGHMHPDVNSFELFSHGVEWMTDPGKRFMTSDFHQTILIDGHGPGGSSAAFSFPQLPGKLLSFTDTPEVTSATGDAKLCYDYLGNRLFRSWLEPPFVATKVESLDLTWGDFVYGMTRNDPMPAWRSKRLEWDVHTNNPVLRANRSAYLFRGKYPFALIVDDIQKDDKPHDYLWIANARPGSVEKLSAQGSDMILKPTEGAYPERQKARLLVRAIHPASATLTLFDGQMPTQVKSKGPALQVRIEAKNVIRPDFITLLVPYTEGTPLPKTSLVGRTLTVTWDGETKTIRLP
jgi:hypothetical protein